MQKMDGKTANIIDENIQKLKELFPEAFTEDKIDFEMLQKLLGENIETEKERYSFTWNGKSEAIKIALKQSTGTLRPDKESSKNWDTTNNLYIEGDNLEVLRLLQNPYRGKIKMVYIDPPYNTGKDFVYTDKFNDTVEDYKERVGETQKTNADSSGRYHTNWLNMMYPRLKLARNLLKDDGVIFISIDDNEQSNLKKICDDVLGEDNFVGTFSVKSTPNARDYGHIGKMHEYCLFYAKNINQTKTYHLEDEKKHFKYNDNLGGYNIHPLYNSNEAFHRGNRPNLYYPFYINPNNKTDDDFYEISLEKSDDSIEILPSISVKNDVQFVWRWGKDKSKDNLNKEIVGYKTNDGEYRIVQKMRTSSKVIRSIFEGKKITSRRGTAEVEELFGKKVFSFPKPISLIENLLKCSTSGGDIVLDFFSGSGSTAHAAMQLNAKDGGNRNFIMVQLPELTDEKSEAYKAGYKTISEIGMERIRRAGDKIKKDELEKIEKELAELEGKLEDEEIKKQKEELKAKKEHIENLDIGIKTFKLDTTNLSIWDEKTDDLEKTLLDNIDAIKDGRSQEDVLYEVLIKYGIDLTVPIEEEELEGKKIYLIAGGYLTVCLEDNLDLSFIEKLAERKPQRVVFRDNGFKDDTVKTNAEMTLKKHGVEDIKVL